MSKKIEEEDDMLDHYDFSGAERGKFLELARRSASIVVLEPDVAEVYKTSEAVNAALRKLVRDMKRTPRVS